MTPRDLFFAEVCDGKLERAPFDVPTSAGPIRIYAEEIDQARLEDWRQEILKNGGDPDAGEYDREGQARLIIRCGVVCQNCEGRRCDECRDDKPKAVKLFFVPDDVTRLTHGRCRYTDAFYELCCQVNRIGSFSLLKKSSAKAPASSSSSVSAATPAGSTSAAPPVS